MSSFARASSLDRLLECVGSEYLGGTDERSAAAKEAATWGTMVHHWVETGEIMTPDGYPKLPALFMRKLGKSGVQREQWWPADTTHEAAIAIVPFETYGLKLDGTKEEKEEWKARQERAITGTADGYWFAFDRLHVDDLKTGRIVDFQTYQHQVMTYALGIARAHAYKGPVHMSLTHWPRYPVDGKPNRLGKVIEAEELNDFEKRLAKLCDDVQRAREGQAVLSAGNHCTWCPSRRLCPELAKHTGN